MWYQQFFKGTNSSVEHFLMNQFKVRWTCSIIHTGTDIDGNINRSCRRSWHNYTRLVQRAITVCTHNPPLHLSHLQPFVRATRQESIHLSLSFTLHTLPLSHTSSPLFHFNHFFFSPALSYLSFYVFSLLFIHIPPLHAASLQETVFFFPLLPPPPAVFDSSLRIRKDQGF